MGGAFALPCAPRLFWEQTRARKPAPSGSSGRIGRETQWMDCKSANVPGLGPRDCGPVGLTVRDDRRAARGDPWHGATLSVEVNQGS